MINHPDYRETILRPGADAHGKDTAARFRTDTLAMHELTNAVRDETGRWQLPWPKALGTQPWAVARRMSEPGGCGVSDAAYSVHVADPRRPGPVMIAITSATAAGHCVPIFVGDALAPRHVALVIGASDDSFTAYDPSNGRAVEVSRAAVRAAAMRLAGWSQLWLAVLPN
jgi:hypothetical protein